MPSGFLKSDLNWEDHLIDLVFTLRSLEHCPETFFAYMTLPFRGLGHLLTWKRLLSSELWSWVYPRRPRGSWLVVYLTKPSVLLIYCLPDVAVGVLDLVFGRVLVSVSILRVAELILTTKINCLGCILYFEYGGRLFKHKDVILIFIHLCCEKVQKN